jgi:G3E family GTPase
MADAAAGARRSSPIPVTVLTGALGAGKTTLLNAALRGVLRNVAVVVNEFGAIGIDHDLIRAATEDVVLLPGGCVCCQVRADLAVALLQLERSAAQGEIPAFDRVVVETSGLAEPGPILQLFAESPALAGRFRIDALVCVVDAQQGVAALADDASATRQALLADRLLVSKSELATPDALARLEERLVALNPQAEILRTPRGVAEAAWFDSAPVAAAREVPAALLRAAHDDAVESFVLHWAAAQPLAALGNWLQGLADTHGARLLRAKGIVAAEGVAGAVALHVVGHLVAAPEFLSRGVDQSRVVLITRGLEPGDVAPPWPFAASRAAAASRAPAMPIPSPLPRAGASCA